MQLWELVHSKDVLRLVLESEVCSKGSKKKKKDEYKVGQQIGIYEADLESTRIAWNLLKSLISMMGVPHGRNRGSLNVELNMHLVKKLKEDLGGARGTAIVGPATATH